MKKSKGCTVCRSLDYRNFYQLDDTTSAIVFTPEGDLTTSDALVLGISHVDGDSYKLEIGYFTEGEEAIAQISQPISYCPFCGRKLQRKENKKKYPWGC